jgi:hypothetical protein
MYSPTTGKVDRADETTGQQEVEWKKSRNTYEGSLFCGSQAGFKTCRKLSKKPGGTLVR